MKKSVVYTILSLAIVAAVCSALYTSTARAGSKANTRAGTYVIRWDFDKDTTTDLQNFGSLLKSGELILDGPVLPAALAGQANPVALGTGHGF